MSSHRRVSRRSFLGMRLGDLLPDGNAPAPAPPRRAAPRPPSASPADVELHRRQVRRALARPGTDELARALEPVAARLVGEAAIEPGRQVLDLGCGDLEGAVAIAAELAEGETTACVVAPEQAERVRARAGAAGVYVTLQTAEPDALPLAAGAYDAVLSAFGVIHAPRPAAVVAEALRVLAPRGRLAFAFWAPDSVVLEAAALARRVVALPPGIPEPERWASTDTVRRLFAGAPGGVREEDATVALRFADHAAARHALATAPGPLNDALAEADGKQRAGLEQALGELVGERFAADAGGGVVAEAPYRLVVTG
jgi:SAM-dependent methyltransferase